jgi:hypothetical protein
MIRIAGIGELQCKLKRTVEHVDGFNWQRIGRDLDQQGTAMMEQLLSPEECRAIAGLYTRTTTSFAVESLWSGIVSGAESTSISAIRSPIFSGSDPQIEPTRGSVLRLWDYVMEYAVFGRPLKWGRLAATSVKSRLPR